MGKTCKAFAICLWESHPDAGNDDCNTSMEFDSLEEAERIFNHADPLGEMFKLKESWRGYYAGVPFLELVSQEIRPSDGMTMVDPIRIRQINPIRKAEKDNSWLCEQAMEAGMAFGCQGYNDAMGW